MEITIKFNNISLNIPLRCITGIITDTNEIDIKCNSKETIVVGKYLNLSYYNKKCLDLMRLEIKNNSLVLKNEEKKITDSLKIVGLKSSTLNKNFNELSLSEKKLFMLALALLHNRDILVIEDPFKELDLKNEKKLSILFRKMKDEYNKTIIFISNYSEIQYKYTDHSIIIKNEKVIIEGNTSEIYQKVPFLIRNRIDIPDIVKVTYLAKKNKNIKIEYHKDVRDIIKDIYKHI